MVLCLKKSEVDDYFSEYNCYKRVKDYLSIHFSVNILDVDISDTRGYFVDREARFHKHHPLHSCLFCLGPFKATYTYIDRVRVCGKIVSPYRTWSVLKNSKRFT